MSDWLFDHAPSFYPKEWDETHLSQHSDQYLLSDDGHLSLVSAAKGGVHGNGGSGGTVIYNPSASQEVLTEVLKSTLNIPPTVRKSQGDRIEILVARDVDFRSVYELRR